MKKGEVVNHILTNDRVLILKELEDEYLVRLPGYAEIIVKSFELEEIGIGYASEESSEGDSKSGCK